MNNRHNANGEIATEIEELNIPVGKNGLYIGSADVTCHMEYEGYDPGDRYTPPSGGHASMYDTEVTKVYLYTSDDDAGGESESNEHKQLVQTWIEENDWVNKNTEWATEQWGEQVEGEREAALESKWEAERDRQRGL
jgi:hypothetical protein